MAGRADGGGSSRAGRTWARHALRRHAALAAEGEAKRVRRATVRLDAEHGEPVARNQALGAAPLLLRPALRDSSGGGRRGATAAAAPEEGNAAGAGVHRSPPSLVQQADVGGERALDNHLARKERRECCYNAGNSQIRAAAVPETHLPGRLPFESSVVHFLAAFSVNPDMLQLRTAPEYSSLLGSLLYCVGMLAAEAFLPSEQRGEYGLAEVRLLL
jgi:hypothetical protein